MRCIDADAMIKRVEEWDTDDPTDRAMYNFTMHRINEQPTIESEQQWIPVSERLPDIKEHHCSKPCIVYCENRAYGFAALEENIFGQVGWNCERDDEYHEPLGKVLAWMPLPAPYRGEGVRDE